jgi:hypothetical protein
MANITCIKDEQADERKMYLVWVTVVVAKLKKSWNSPNILRYEMSLLMTFD